MSLRINRSRNAKMDVIEEAFRLSEVASIETSNRFVEATKQAYKRLAQTPGVGALRDYDNPDNVGMRFWAVPGFPKQLIFYRIEGDTLQILRVLHGARDLQAIFGPDDEDE